MRILFCCLGLFFSVGVFSAEAKVIQGFMDWSIGMSKADVLSSTYADGGRVTPMSSRTWYGLNGQYKLSFLGPNPESVKIRLRFERERLVQIQVIFFETASAKKAAEFMRKGTEYFRGIGEIPRDRSFDKLDLEEEIKEAGDLYTYYFSEQRYLNVHARLYDGLYRCTFSIHDNGSGAVPDPTPSMTKETDEDTVELEMWEMKLSGNSELVFKKSLASINALLVKSLQGGGNAASTMKLSVTAVDNNSSGSVTVGFNQPIGGDMRRASEEVVRAIQVKHGKLPGNMDIEFGFADKWGGKDGPSAAVACAVLLESLFEGFEIPKDFAVTGDLNADSTVQPVGGVADKIRGAMEQNCTVIGLPKANEGDVTDLVVEENLRRFLKVKVYTLAHLNDAIDLANPAGRSGLQKQAIKDFDVLQKELVKGGVAVLYSKATDEKLKKILSAVPNLYSAKILQVAAKRQLPTRYSLAGTLIRIDSAMSPFAESIEDIRNGSAIENYQFGRKNPLLEARNRLIKLKVKSDKRLIKVINAEINLIGKFQNLINSNAKSGTVLDNYLNDLKESASRSDDAWKAVRSNKEIQDQLMKRGINL